MTDERYGYGTNCTWHGPLTFSVPAVRVDWANDESDEAAACPKCGSPLKTDLSAEVFQARCAAVDRHRPGYDDMMRWSQGKCFPDFDTMQNAYRQAMEGTT